MTNYKTNRFYYLTLGVFSVLSLFYSSATSAQDEDWEPQTFVTGYTNVIAEFTDESSHKEINKDIGIGLAEVGFLASYKPLRNLEFKSTLVWKQDVPDLQSLLVEAYGTYTVNEKFKIGAGKFLTPLSPVNTYFYAPLNPSVALPMVISHYFLTPQSISGLQLSGQFGSDLKVNYNLTYGNYTTIGHIKGGIINLLGNEDLANLQPAPKNLEQNYDLGGSARLAFDYDFLTIGANYFDGTRATLSFVDFNTFETRFLSSRKWSFGVDFHLNFDEKLKLNAEYWVGGNKTVDDPNNLDASTGNSINATADYDGYYAEVLYTLGKFTPYVRYEGLTDLGYATSLGTAYNSIDALGFGLAYRPRYELLFKVDYRKLGTTAKGNDIILNAFSVEDTDFSHLILSAVFSF